METGGLGQFCGHLEKMRCSLQSIGPLACRASWLAARSSWTGCSTLNGWDMEGPIRHPPTASDLHIILAMMDLRGVKAAAPAHYHIAGTILAFMRPKLKNFSPRRASDQGLDGPAWHVAWFTSNPEQRFNLWIQTPIWFFWWCDTVCVLWCVIVRSNRRAFGERSMMTKNMVLKLITLNFMEKVSNESIEFLAR